MSQVAVLMGSPKDRPLMESASKTLSAFDVSHDVMVLSAHKTPDEAFSFASTAEESGYRVIIAGAGKAAHLAGVMAAKTTLPVIGVPLSASLDGLDALLSTVQMPTGVPVATVAVDGAENAALLAIEILALENESLARKLREYRRQLADDLLGDTQ